MVNSAAAIRFLDRHPTDDEVEEFAYESLEDFPADNATATPQIVYTAPDWLPTNEQDQINAFIRDGRRGKCCVLVIYMEESEELFGDDDD